MKKEEKEILIFTFMFFVMLITCIFVFLSINDSINNMSEEERDEAIGGFSITRWASVFFPMVAIIITIMCVKRHIKIEKPCNKE